MSKSQMGDRAPEFLAQPSPRLRLSQHLCLSHCTKIVAVLSAIALPFITFVPKVTAQTAAQGYGLLQKGWVNDAIAAFQQALRQSPNSLEAKLGLAIAYQKAGRDGEAWTAYQQVLAQDSQNRTALAAVGVLGGYRPEWQSVGIAALTTLLSVEPTNQSARSQRALLLGYQGRFAESFADYAIALQNPTPQVLLEAAKVYSYSGDFAQSLALFRRYQLQGKPLPDDYALVAYAAALRGTGQASTAAKLLSDRLTQVVAKRGNQSPSPIEIDLRTGLAIAMQANGQLEQGLATLAPIRNLPAATLPLARALSEMGRKSGNTALSEEAIALYRQALNQTSSRSVGLLMEIANVFNERSATRAEAMQLYQEVARSPNAPLDLGFRLAQSYFYEGDLGKAKQALQPYLAANPADFGAELLLAEIERRENNLEASAQRYQSLRERAINAEVTATALQALAGIRQTQGRTNEALQTYDQLLAIAPQDWSARFGRASLAYEAQRLTEAEADRLIADWSQTQTVPPAGLYRLVGALPAAAKREQLYSQLLAAEPTNLAIQKRQIQLLALRDRPAAQQRLDQLRQAFPDDTNTRFAVGELAQTIGNLTLASQAYESILKEQSANPSALAALGGVRFQQERYSEAEAIYARVLALRPTDWDVQRILAELSLAQDQPFTALERLQTARQMQIAQDIPDPELKLSDRIVKLQVDRLKRRGFQPSWERY
jgi:cellulose synthase operon protein C